MALILQSLPMEMKKLSLLSLLLFAVLACTDSKNRGTVEDDHFGNLNREDQADDVIFEEPEPPPGEGITIPEPEVCDPVAITPYSLEEARAGEEYSTLISATGACNRFNCTLVSGPEWLEMDGCSLRGTPNTSESLGEHAIQVKVEDQNDPNSADVRDLTLTVYDEPEIVPYVSRSCGPTKVKGKKEKQKEIKQKNLEHFDITLGRAEFCLRIEGYADEYEVALDGNDHLSAERISDKLYRVTGLEEASKGKPLALTATAVDHVGHEAYKEFDLTLHANPCDTPLSVRVKDTWKEVHYRGELAENEVVLGSKYRVVFEVTGGEGPYQWDFSSVIPHQADPVCQDPENPQSFRGGLCGDHAIESNPNWIELDSEGGEENTAELSLETEFSFPGKDLPYDITFSQTIKDQLTVTVRSASCKAETGRTFEKTKEHTLTMVLPVESVSDIKVQQDFERDASGEEGDESGNIQDHNDMSRMGIILEDRGGNAAAVVEYKLAECDRDIRRCTDSKSATPADTLRIDSAAEINKLFLAFVDWSSNDSWCSWDCDDDQLDYYLESLTFTTKYRTVTWVDTENRIKNQVTPDPSGGWAGDIGDNWNCPYTNPTYNCLDAERGIVTPDGSEMCVTQSNSTYHFAGTVHSHCKYFYKTYSFDFPTWHPRLRPDYSED